MERRGRGERRWRGDRKGAEGTPKIFKVKRKKKSKKKSTKGFGCMQESQRHAGCWRNEVSVRVLVPIGKKSTAATTNGLH